MKDEYVRAWAPEDCDTPGYRFELTRRELAGLGVGLVLSLMRPATVAGAEMAVARIHISDGELSASMGTVTLLTGKIEMGQGSRTVLTQVVAEEMHVAPADVRVVMGDTALVPDDGGTWGSLTCALNVPVIRKAAAAAYKAIAPVSPSEWKVCGTSLLPVKGREIVTGRLKYATDLKLPGMLRGSVVRARGYRAGLERWGGASTLKLVRDGDFLGVLEADPNVVDAHWSIEPLPSRDGMFAGFRNKATAPKPGEGGRYPALIVEGDVKAGLASSARLFEAEYRVPNIAHVPLEPRAAIAEWKDGRLTVWSGTQAPFLVRKELAAAFRISDADVRVVACDIGGAYGGKQRGECELEAARLARASNDAPVKLAWTREEEFTASYCRPAGVLVLKTGVDAAGRITAWHHVNYNSGAAALRPPYAIPHMSCEYHRAESPLRQGSYRSLAGVANTFAREMQVDEMARTLNADPLEYRLRNIEDARLKTVLERAAERFQWKRQRGTGLSCNLEKDGRFALFVEMDQAGIHVRRMVLAMDVGAILNPHMLRNQATGALIQGIGGALWEELRFDSQRIVTTKLSTYRVPRFSDTPRIEVVLVDRRDIESAGSGEAPITVVAPAIGAALRTLRSEPFRSLPLLTKINGADR